MPAPYIEEYLFRGRCQEAEKGIASEFYVVIGQFIVGPDGKQSHVKTDPLTPAQAAAAGFNLDVILGNMAAAAIKDAAAQAARAATAEERQAEAEAALAERDTALANALAQAAAAEDAGPSNPLLNKLTFGKFGN